MQKTFTLCLLGLACSAGAMAQSPITLTGGASPTAAAQASFGYAATFNVPAPQPGTNMVWDYGNLMPTNIVTTSYSPGPVTGVPAANLTVGDQFAELVPGYGYDFSALLHYSPSGFSSVGRLVPAQSYSMLPVTGVATDSLTIPAQAAAFSSPSVNFPASATYPNNWQSAYSFSLNALVDVSAFGMMNIPTQKKSNVLVLDSVMGWGTMVVPLQAGPSVPYPVLMVKRVQITNDSLYMNGAPAPASMLAALNQTQGQVTRANSYIFYRQNSFIPLAQFRYGSSPFSQPEEIIFDRSADVQVNGLAAELAAFPVQLYPNPATGASLTLSFEKPDAANWQFTLTDATGRRVYQQTVATGSQQLSLPASAANGLYLWQLSDENGNLKATGKVNLLR